MCGGHKRNAKIRRHSKGNVAALTDPQACTWALWKWDNSVKYYRQLMSQIQWGQPDGTLCKGCQRDPRLTRGRGFEGRAPAVPRGAVCLHARAAFAAERLSKRERACWPCRGAPMAELQASLKSRLAAMGAEPVGHSVARQTGVESEVQ